MSKLAAYLAKNYLTASNPSTSSRTHQNQDYDEIDHDRPKKKRKKDKNRRNDEGNGLVIADDDEDSLLSTSSRRKKRGTHYENGDSDDNEDGGPAYDANVRSAEFRKKKTSAWTTVTDGSSTKETKQSKTNGSATGAPEREQEQDEADRILQEAADEAAQRRRDIDDEDQPAIVETGTRMESGIRAGLQTAADTARMMAEEEEEKAAESRRQKEEERERRKRRKDKARNDDGNDDDDQKDNPEEQTIYRDATGRRIDISLRKAEIRAQELAKLAAEKKSREEAMGDVQRRKKEDRRKELDEAKFLSLGRSVDDEEMNQRLKEEIRADDPMAQYMMQKRAEEDEGPQSDDEQDGAPARRTEDKTGGRTGVVARRPTKKVYQGHAPPNRYGILPGWRWDGVDRGNGFEKLWFQARSNKSRNQRMEYEWQMDE